MKNALKFFVFILVSASLTGCILSFTPHEEQVTVILGETQTFSVKTLFSDDCKWVLDDVEMPSNGNSFEYSPVFEDMGDTHTLTIESSFSFLSTSQQWQITVYGEPPALNDLAIKNFSSQSITLAQPTQAVAGAPAPTVNAYIGMDGTISNSGSTISNSIEGPVDVSADSYQFFGLSMGTSYRIIVVAENVVGNSVKEITAVPAVPEVDHDSYLGIRDDEMGHLRWILKLADEPLDDFTNIDAFDEAQFGLSSYRYSIAFSVYFLGTEQFHKFPACAEVIQPRMDRLIQKMLQKPVWDYWENTSQGVDWLEPNMDTPYPAQRDPVGKQNIMYSGHLGQMIATYEMLYRDLKWSEPGSIQFVWSDDEKYIYDNHFLQKLMYDQMMYTPDNCIECEPNACFPECNQHPILSFMLYDHVYGTNLAEAREAYMDFHLRENMIDPVTHENCMFYLVKQQKTIHNEFPDFGNDMTLIFIPATFIGFMNLHSSSANGWTGTFMHAWEPEYIERHYQYQKAAHVIENPDGTAYLTHDTVTDQISTGFFAMLVSEIGDMELRDKLVEWSFNLYNPIWEEGTLHYPNNPALFMNYSGEYVAESTALTGKLIAFSIANPKDGQWTMHNKPFTDGNFAEPKVTGVADDYPNLLLRRAIYDREKEALVITTSPGTGTGGTSSFEVVQLDPARIWHLSVDGVEQATYTGVSSVTITVDLDKTYNIALIAE